MHACLPIAATILNIVMCPGPPSTPTELAATRSTGASLRISWSLVAREAVNFTVTATNLNDSTEMMTVLEATQDRHKIVSPPDNTSCDTYSFQVRARNAAGSSNLSTSITSTFPSLPDLSSLERSMEYSLTHATHGVLLSLTFNVRMLVCLIVCLFSCLFVCLLYFVVPGFGKVPAYRENISKAGISSKIATNCISSRMTPTCFLLFFF